MRYVLTPRQAQICKLACQGLDNSEIGEAVGLPLNSIKKHVLHSMRKLGVNDRVVMIERCFALGVADGSSRQSLPETLTERQHMVIAGVLRGFESKEIGRILGMGYQVAKNHLRKAYDKCGVWSRAELVARYTI